MPSVQGCARNSTSLPIIMPSIRTTPTPIILHPQPRITVPRDHPSSPKSDKTPVQIYQQNREVQEHSRRPRTSRPARFPTQQEQRQQELDTGPANQAYSKKRNRSQKRDRKLGR